LFENNFDMIKLKTFFKPTYKLLIHGVVLALLIWVLIDSIESMQRMSQEHNYHVNFIIYSRFKVIAQIFTFYILSWWLIPLFITNKKKGAILIFLYAILYTISISWLDINITNLISDLNNNLTYSTNLRAFMSFIPLTFLSSLYSISIIDRVLLNKSFTAKQLEIVVNFVVVGLILDFFLNNVNSGVLMTIIIYACLKLFFFYSNTFFITPILLKEKKTSKYFFSVVLLLLIYILSYKFFHSITHFEIGPFPDTIFLIFSVFIDYTLSFIYGFIRHRIKNKSIALDAKDSELKLLKSQVNPHFLFNTLNTLYSTALEENAPKTAESTAKLASLIRYMQEDINKDFIPLENEIKYLEDYITIQKLRCSVEPDIETKFIHIENHKLSPGLLIPFVENAFKYGIDPSKKSKLVVSVICTENTISFQCINSYDENYKTYYKEQGFGIGIKNAKRRLHLVYPNNHTIVIKKEKNIFSVKLNISIKNK